MNETLAVAIGIYIAYTAFCRARVMTKDTEAPIRWCFAAMGMCGLMVAGGELALMLPDPQWWVEYRWHALGLSFAATQTVTSKFWRRGTPPSFQTAARNRDDFRLVAGGHK